MITTDSIEHLTNLTAQLIKDLESGNNRKDVEMMNKVLRMVTFFCTESNPAYKEKKIEYMILRRYEEL